MAELANPTMPPRLASVPAFPPIVMKLLALLGDDNSSVATIAACIATDPVFAARVLKRANAADVTGYQPTCDILQALVTIGIERTRQLALTIATMAYLGGALKEEQLRRCWTHTVACALASSQIAQMCDLNPAEAYTAGLLHDIGRLGLITAYRSEYQRAMAEATEEADLLALERERFGVDHTEAGQWLAEQWKLTTLVAQIARHHHEEPTAELNLMTVVQVACRLADFLGFSVNEKSAPGAFGEITAALPSPVRARLLAALSALATQTREQLAFFGCSDVALPARPIEVKMLEDEESDFVRDFPLADSASVAVGERSTCRGIIVALIFAGALVLALLCGVRLLPFAKW